MHVCAYLSVLLYIIIANRFFEDAKKFKKKIFFLDTKILTFTRTYENLGPPYENHFEWKRARPVHVLLQINIF